MTAGTQNANAYLKTKVLTATPEELRLMLLDGGIKFARQGRDGITRKDYEASYTGLSQSRDIVMELITTVRDEIDPELAAKVRGVYTFIYTLLVEGSFEKDVAKVDKAIELLEFERETWAMLMQKLAEERRTAQAPARPATDAGPAPGPDAPRRTLSVQG
ncbi:MAG: flagellar export chaperone FliS [Phycisphaerales bacterium]|nr:flagellar export chaperone FliS [Phycisphaerales bacterium]